MSSRLAIRGGTPLFSESVHYRWPLIDKSDEEAVVEQLHQALSIYDKSGVVAEFEDSFATMHNRKFGLITSSGTAAMHSVLYALGIGPNDEVICPTYTFFATATPLFQLGALPVLADCTPYGGLEIAEIKRLITPKTKAVIVTHMWGLPCDMDEIVSVCQEQNLFLIEDCSHSPGASYKGKMTGTFGDAAIWSLQTHKLVAAGEGGIILTDNCNGPQKLVKLIRFSGQSVKS